MKQLLLLPFLFITVISFGQVPSYVPTNGLVGYWPFNGNANDESGNSNDGTVNGAALTTDRFGNANSAYDFDGQSNISVNRNYQSSFTVSLWFNPISTPGFNPLIEAFDSNWELQLKVNTIDYIGFAGLSSQEYISSVTAQVNAWQHLVCAFVNDSVFIYHNGLLTDVFLVLPLPINNGTYNFGSSISGLAQYFNGKLDDIGIWNRALDSCEVKDLFDGSLGNCCTSNPITSQPANQSTSIGNDATFSFTDNLTGATYQWQMNAGTGYSDLSNAGQFSGTDTQTLTISSTSMSNNNTLYRCVVTESASCSDTTDVVTLTVSESGTSINELNSALVKIYPNPSDGIINLVLNDYSAGKIVLTDMLGKEVLNKSFTSKEVQINLKSLASKGTYFAKVIDLDGNIIAIKKLIYQ